MSGGEDLHDKIRSMFHVVKPDTPPMTDDALEHAAKVDFIRRRSARASELVREMVEYCGRERDQAMREAFYLTKLAELQVWLEDLRDAIDSSEPK